MSSAKILITGMPNTGKTTLLSSLKNVLVVSRDGKPFSLPMPHYNVEEYSGMANFLEQLENKVNAYSERFGKMPETIAFDSVSRLFTDIENDCNKRYVGFNVWTNVNKDINEFLNIVQELQNTNINVVLIAHVMWDEKAGKFVETSKGSFQKIGGFLSTVDYAINVDVIGKKHIVTLKGTNLSRSLLSDIPEKQDASEFNLQDYLDKIRERINKVTEEWSI